MRGRNYFLISQFEKLVNDREGFLVCLHTIIDTRDQVGMYIGQQGFEGLTAIGEEKREHAMIGKFVLSSSFYSCPPGSNHNRMFFPCWEAH